MKIEKYKREIERKEGGGKKDRRKSQEEKQSDRQKDRSIKYRLRRKILREGQPENETWQEGREQK